MKISITDINQAPLDQDPFVPKTKLVAALEGLAALPGDSIPLEQVKTVLGPFISDLDNKEIYERTSGYVQILDEVLRQVKPSLNPHGSR